MAKVHCCIAKPKGDTVRKKGAEVVDEEDFLKKKVEDRTIDIVEWITSQPGYRESDFTSTVPSESHW